MHSFPAFLLLMEKGPHDADSDIEEEVREAFRVFDTEGYGYITTDDIAAILTGIGDKLTKGLSDIITFGNHFMNY